MSLSCFEVVSPPMDYYEDYFPELGGGPMSVTRDFCFVWARSSRDAVKAAVRHWQRRCPRPRNRWGINPCCYPHRQREDGMNPYVGVTASVLEVDR